MLFQESPEARDNELGNGTDFKGLAPRPCQLIVAKSHFVHAGHHANPDTGANTIERPGNAPRTGLSEIASQRVNHETHAALRVRRDRPASAR